uniref:CRISPR system Cms protein Csm4 n=1 Tax=candidate division WOR-3 bacterium TaxID=2052148 RepID=A0A7C4UBS2_UNCW3
MKKLRIKIKPKAPFASELNSDTFFGHICWGIKYLYSEDELTKFLKRYYEESETKPLIISSGFPMIDDEELYPKPVLRPLNKEEEDCLSKYFNGEKIIFYSALKTLKKQSFISRKILEELKNNLSYHNLYKCVFEGNYCPVNFLKKPEKCKSSKRDCSYFTKNKCDFIKSISSESNIFHNTINRLTNTVEEKGGFYSTKNTFYEESVRIWIYIYYDDFEIEKIKEIFNFISISGFGKDKSTGKGYFDFEIEENVIIPKSDNPDAFIVLSNYYPKKDDFQNAQYDIFTKIGKLGGDFANLKSIPHFKKPLLFIRPGSTIKPYNFKDFYGDIVRNVHTDERIIQYGITIPLFVRVLWG